MDASVYVCLFPADQNKLQTAKVCICWNADVKGNLGWMLIHPLHLLLLTHILLLDPCNCYIKTSDCVTVKMEDWQTTLLHGRFQQQHTCCLWLILLHLGLVQDTHVHVFVCVSVCEYCPGYYIMFHLLEWT